MDEEIGWVKKFNQKEYSWSRATKSPDSEFGPVPWGTEKVILVQPPSDQFLLAYTGTSTETHSWTLHRAWWILECSVLNGTSSSNASPQCSEDYEEARAESLWGSEKMGDSKATGYWRHEGTEAHGNPQRLWWQVPDLHRLELDGMLGLRRGGGYGAPTPNQEVTAADFWLQWESKFTPVESHWEDDQHKRNSMAVL